MNLQKLVQLDTRIPIGRVLDFFGFALEATRARGVTLGVLFDKAESFFCLSDALLLAFGAEGSVGCELLFPSDADELFKPRVLAFFAFDSRAALAFFLAPFGKFSEPLTFFCGFGAGARGFGYARHDTLFKIASGMPMRQAPESRRWGK